MPEPVTEPTPAPPSESRFLPPEEAQEASYLAASARIESFSATESFAMSRSR